MKKYLREEGGTSVIVVESPMTALKLMSMGFNRVVATFGAFSREQGMLLLAVPLVYFWPDNDAAGWENAQRCIETLGKMTTVKIVPVVLGDKSDAAELAQPDEVLEYLNAAYPSTLFAAKTGGKRLPTLAQISR
jgi:DNA primase